MGGCDLWVRPSQLPRLGFFCGLLQFPPEAPRSHRLKENLDVMSRLLFSAGFMSPVVERERGEKTTPKCPLAEVLSSSPHSSPSVCVSVRLSPSLWKLKGQGRLIRMQRRKALLQIENILILLMLGGRGGERQRYRGGKRWGERKEGEKGG